MMCCPKCNSCYIRYDIVNDGMRTKTSEVSLARKIGRGVCGALYVWTLALCAEEKEQ